MPCNLQYKKFHDKVQQFCTTGVHKRTINPGTFNFARAFTIMSQFHKSVLEWAFDRFWFCLSTKFLSQDMISAMHKLQICFFIGYLSYISNHELCLVYPRCFNICIIDSVVYKRVHRLVDTCVIFLKSRFQPAFKLNKVISKD